MIGGKADLICDFPSLIYHKSSLICRFATLLGGKAEVENHKSGQKNDRSEVKNRQKHEFPPISDEHCSKSDRPSRHPLPETASAEMGSAPAPGAADDALVVGLCDARQQNNV